MLRKIFTAWIPAFAGMTAKTASACAVCFGGADSKLTRGFFWGIIVLGILPFVLLVAFISTIAAATRKNQSR
jgi:hypothetical protein